MKLIAIIFGILAIGLAIFIGSLIFKNGIIPDFSFIVSDGPSDNSQSNGATPSPLDSGNGNQNIQVGDYPETIITLGPSNGEFVKDTMVAAFKFSAVWDDLDDIVYETRLIPIDENWDSNSIGGVSYELLSGDNEYIFEVRAKTRDGIVDATPEKRNFRAVVSPYMNKILISSARPGIFPSNIMRIVLRNNGDEDVNINGWKISGTKGSYSISKAVSVYRQGEINDPEDLILRKGGEVIIRGENSPMNMNFQLNTCTGYLNGTYNFSPSLPNNCPRPTSSDMTGVLPPCRNYLLGLGSCVLPDPNKLNSFASDSNCRSFADDNLNYRGCFDNYYRDNDFLSGKWQLYSGTNFLDRDNDDLELRDKDGLLIDRYYY